MAKNVTQYDLLISCPSDIKDEIQCIKDVVDQFNNSFSDSLGVSIRIKHWSKNSYPQSGGKPQELLNEQFIFDCDAAVAIMWTRFGTPTDEYGSGTEEEIEIMLKDGKQVFMYFCDKPLAPSMMDSDEYKKVIAFKEKYKDRGIYYTFSSTEDFKKVFYAHLSQHFLSLNKVESLKNERHPNLLIKGINLDNFISDDTVIKKFKLENEYDSEGYLAKIKRYYSEIDSIKLVKSSKNYPYSFSLEPLAKIDHNIQTVIEEVAKTLDVNMSDCFFDLGALHKSLNSISIYSSVSGTEEEEKKYRLIHELHTSIQDFYHWGSVDMVLSDLKSIGLILTNNGTDYDEDVEVSLSFPKSALVTVDSFPELSADNKKYLIKKRDLGKILKIPATAEYLDYDASIVHQTRLASSVNPIPNFFESVQDISDRFDNCLSNAFGVDVYSTDDKYIVKVQFDYIKHNTSVAFPAIILLFDDIPEIPYTITSKHCAEKVNGIIAVTK